MFLYPLWHKVFSSIWHTLTWILKHPTTYSRNGVILPYTSNHTNSHSFSHSLCLLFFLSYYLSFSLYVFLLFSLSLSIYLSINLSYTHTHSLSVIFVLGFNTSQMINFRFAGSFLNRHSSTFSRSLFKHFFATVCSLNNLATLLLAIMGFCQKARRWTRRREKREESRTKDFPDFWATVQKKLLCSKFSTLRETLFRGRNILACSTPPLLFWAIIKDLFGLLLTNPGNFFRAQ